DIIRPPAWMKDVACVEHADHASDWFPERGQNKALERAKWLCTGCLVRGECLQFAVENNITEGVWGGLSPSDRRTCR
ncbi:MAG TPA: WhiB family transcriptional regulator, partial [Acidimicrobiia bacterium]|nr:WhiB family transcriptional regulator [Acidimicrobiia bacterium]